MSRSGSAPCGLRGSERAAAQPQHSTSVGLVSHGRVQLAKEAFEVGSLVNKTSRGRAQSVGSERSDGGLEQDNPRPLARDGRAAGSIANVQGPRHEGWLWKRTSHKLAARWQSRYWSLEGCVLRYHKLRDGPPLRSFDLRRVRSISMPDGFPRELELNFGFRVWRLRAENPQAARRWMFLLDAARLVAGAPSPMEIEDNLCYSDDDADSASSRTSSTSSVMSTDPFSLRTTARNDGRNSSSNNKSASECTASDDQGGSVELPIRVKNTLSCTSPLPYPSPIQALLPQALAPAPVKAPSPKIKELLAAPAIADRLEIDPDELDRNFDAWLGDTSSGGDGTPHFGDTGPTQLRKGLGLALAGLWAAFGGDGPQQAISAWKGSQMPDPRAFADIAEGVLSEYLSRMLTRLERWLKACDPMAEEVADAAVWLLFDAVPALEQFETLASSELSIQSLSSWRDTFEQMEILLLGEWETRSCDELCQSAEAAYTAKLAARALFAEVHDGSQDAARVDALLGSLRATLHAEVWRGHAAACDRSASVLIAALNSILRCYRSYVRALLGLAVQPSNSGSAKRRLGKVLSRLSKNTLPCIDDSSLASSGALRVAIANAAAEAASFTNFCREALPSRCPAALAEACSDVLLAFSAAFEREGAELCKLLAKEHFAVIHRQVLKEISFSSLRCSPHDTPEQKNESGILADACKAANFFLEEVTAGSESACWAQASDAVTQVIVRRWVKALCRGPPRVSVATLAEVTSAIDADESALRRLAGCHAEARWANVLASEAPLQPLREIRQMFEDSTPETLSFGAARLDVVLGTELGAAVASAVRYALAH